MSRLLKIVIATVVFATFAFVYNSMTNGGQAVVWAISGIAYGAALALASKRAMPVD